MKLQSQLVITLLVFCYLIIAAPCFAHKVRIFAWNEGDTIYTESKFSGGKVAQNSVVTVVDKSTGEELIQGTTDKNGLFQFPTPDTNSAEIDIIVSSGDGHKNHWLYQLSPIVSRTTVPPKQNLAAETVNNNNNGSSPSVHLTQEQLTELMDNLLEAKLAPIRQELARQQEKEPSLQDILGGIGYLLGLAGIAAYMKSKNNKGEVK
jgi:nickel transport protein